MIINEAKKVKLRVVTFSGIRAKVLGNCVNSCALLYVKCCTFIQCAHEIDMFLA